MTHSDLNTAVNNFARSIEGQREALNRARIALELSDETSKPLVRRAVKALEGSIANAESRLPELRAELAELETLEKDKRAAEVTLDDAGKALALGAATAKEVAKLRAERDGAEGVCKFLASKYALAIQRLGQRATPDRTEARRAQLGVERAEDFLRAYREHGHETTAGYQFAKRAASIVNGLDGLDAAFFVSALAVAVASYVDAPKRPASKLREQAKRAIEFVIASTKPKTSAATVAA